MAQSLQDFKGTQTIAASNGQKYTLQPLLLEDLEAFYILHSDPRVWQHYPPGRHQDVEESKQALQDYASRWGTGISYWSVKTMEGSLAGVGGVRSYLGGICWNIYYRISPEHGCRGLATKLSFEAIDLARRANPDSPVISYMLANNPASIRVAEKIGFARRWEGPDAGNIDKQAVRYIYSDRPLKEDVLNALIALE